VKDSNLNGDGAKLSLHKLDEERPENALDHAVAYTGMGLTVVPNEGKKPRLKEWNKKRLSEDELTSYFVAGRNVGLVNGELSGWLVAVDLDVPEAIAISGEFLPETLSGGREGTPHAHAFYVAGGAKTGKWQDADGTMLLELRSDGCQTLVEPSVHPTGEAYRWNRGGPAEPIEVDAGLLHRQCTELATATAVARRMPPVGGRHEFAKAVLGLLMRHLDV